jgi:predicted dithiol-disulfide oxidoreductase (DUF899 family)
MQRPRIASRNEWTYNFLDLTPLDRQEALRWFLVNRQSTHSWQKIVFIAESFLL